MSEELIRHGEHEEAEFEREDLSPRSVISFFVGLAVAGILIYFVLTGIYKLLNAYEARNQPQQNPLIKAREADTRTVTSGDVQQFPEPRLESNERTELNDYRLREEQTLNSYGWVDQKAGIVHIPIDHAMELIAERGLPTRLQAGTVPPSTVNMAREAAAKADRSQKAPAKQPKQ